MTFMIKLVNTCRSVFFIYMTDNKYKRVTSGKTIKAIFMNWVNRRNAVFFSAYLFTCKKEIMPSIHGSKPNKGYLCGSELVE